MAAALPPAGRCVPFALGIITQPHRLANYIPIQKVLNALRAPLRGLPLWTLGVRCFRVTLSYEALERGPYAKI